MNENRNRLTVYGEALLQLAEHFYQAGSKATARTLLEVCLSDSHSDGLRTAGNQALYHLIKGHLPGDEKTLEALQLLSILGTDFSESSPDVAEGYRALLVLAVTGQDSALAHYLLLKNRTLRFQDIMEIKKQASAEISLLLEKRAQRLAQLEQSEALLHAMLLSESQRQTFKTELLPEEALPDAAGWYRDADGVTYIELEGKKQDYFLFLPDQNGKTGRVCIKSNDPAEVTAATHQKVLYVVQDAGDTGLWWVYEKETGLPGGARTTAGQFDNLLSALSHRQSQGADALHARKSILLTLIRNAGTHIRNTATPSGLEQEERHFSLFADSIAWMAASPQFAGWLSAAGEQDINDVFHAIMQQATSFKDVYGAAKTLWRLLNGVSTWTFHTAADRAQLLTKLFLTLSVSIHTLPAEVTDNGQLQQKHLKARLSDYLSALIGLTDSPQGDPVEHFKALFFELADAIVRIAPSLTNETRMILFSNTLNLLLSGGQLEREACYTLLPQLFPGAVRITADFSPADRVTLISTALEKMFVRFNLHASDLTADANNLSRTIVDSVKALLDTLPFSNDPEQGRRLLHAVVTRLFSNTDRFSGARINIRRKLFTGMVAGLFSCYTALHAHKKISREDSRFLLNNLFNTETTRGYSLSGFIDLARRFMKKLHAFKAMAHFTAREKIDLLSDIVKHLPDNPMTDGQHTGYFSVVATVINELLKLKLALKESDKIHLWVQGIERLFTRRKQTMAEFGTSGLAGLQHLVTLLWQETQQQASIADFSPVGKVQLYSALTEAVMQPLHAARFFTQVPISELSMNAFFTATLQQLQPLLAVIPGQQQAEALQRMLNAIARALAAWTLSEEARQTLPLVVHKSMKVFLAATGLTQAEKNAWLEKTLQDLPHPGLAALTAAEKTAMFLQIFSAGDLSSFQDMDAVMRRIRPVFVPYTSLEEDFFPRQEMALSLFRGMLRRLVEHHAPEQPARPEIPLKQHMLSLSMTFVQQALLPEVATAFFLRPQGIALLSELVREVAVISTIAGLSDADRAQVVTELVNKINTDILLPCLTDEKELASPAILPVVLPFYMTHPENDSKDSQTAALIKKLIVVSGPRSKADHSKKRLQSLSISLDYIVRIHLLAQLSRDNAQELFLKMQKMARLTQGTAVSNDTAQIRSDIHNSLTSLLTFFDASQRARFSVMARFYDVLSEKVALLRNMPNSRQSGTDTSHMMKQMFSSDAFTTLSSPADRSEAISSVLEQSILHAPLAPFSLAERAKYIRAAAAQIATLPQQQGHKLAAHLAIFSPEAIPGFSAGTLRLHATLSQKTVVPDRQLSQALQQIKEEFRLLRDPEVIRQLIPGRLNDLLSHSLLSTLNADQTFDFTRRFLLETQTDKDEAGRLKTILFAGYWDQIREVVFHSPGVSRLRGSEPPAQGDIRSNDVLKGSITQITSEIHNRVLLPFVRSFLERNTSTSFVNTTTFLFNLLNEVLLPFYAHAENNEKLTQVTAILKECLASKPFSTWNFELTTACIIHLFQGIARFELLKGIREERKVDFFATVVESVLFSDALARSTATTKQALLTTLQEELTPFLTTFSSASTAELQARIRFQVVFNEELLAFVAEPRNKHNMVTLVERMLSSSAFSALPCAASQASAIFSIMQQTLHRDPQALFSRVEKEKYLSTAVTQTNVLPEQEREALHARLESLVPKAVTHFIRESAAYQALLNRTDIAADEKKHMWLHNVRQEVSALPRSPHRENLAFGRFQDALFHKEWQAASSESLFDFTRAFLHEMQGVLFAREEGILLSADLLNRLSHLITRAPAMTRLRTSNPLSDFTSLSDSILPGSMAHVSIGIHNTVWLPEMTRILARLPFLEARRRILDIFTEVALPFYAQSENNAGITQFSALVTHVLNSGPFSVLDADQMNRLMDDLLAVIKHSALLDQAQEDRKMDLLTRMAENFLLAPAAASFAAATGSQPLMAVIKKKLEPLTRNFSSIARAILSTRIRFYDELRQALQTVVTAPLQMRQTGAEWVALATQLLSCEAFHALILTDKREKNPSVRHL